MDPDQEFTEKSGDTDNQDSSSDVIDDSRRRATREAALRKAAAVCEACRWRDISKLRALAESEGGFLNDDLRKSACMFCRQTTGPSASLDKC